MTGLHAGPAPPEGSHRLSRKERTAETRRRLSNIALELFATQGFERTTVAEIVARAGVSERTFFDHFPTKSDALHTLSPESPGPMIEAVLDVAPEVGDLEAVYQVGIARLQSHRRDARSRHRVARLLHQSAGLSHVVQGKRREMQIRFEQHLTEALAARRGRRVPTADDRIVATSLAQLLIQAFTAWSLSDDPDGFTRIAYEYQRALTSALCAPGAWTAGRETGQSGAGAPSPGPSGE
jgi:AcrR family transcriptional regulator